MLNVEKLRSLRKSKEMSQQAVADATGMSVMSIKFYETGRRTPSTENALKLARFYGVRVEELFT